MRVSLRFIASALFFLLAPTPPASAQFMFLDTNGDGINDSSDRIDPSAPTTVDIWLDTAANRDGSPASCDVGGTTGLTINSWEVVLRAIGGTLRWGPLENVLDISDNRACFAGPSDTTDPVWYHNGWGGYTILQPGRYLVGRLTVSVVTGDPAIAIMPYNPSQPTDLTSFGSQCLGQDGDNTYKLGLDWKDVAGIGGPLVADAGGPYLGSPTIPIQFDGRATLSSGAHPLSFAWDFGDGAQATGPTPTHAYASLGDYKVRLSVTDGEFTHATSTYAKIIDRTPPVARAGGPYSGFVAHSILFDGRRSTDANGDALTYTWSFGDATGAVGDYAFHIYYRAGQYTVRLAVSDGAFVSLDSTTAIISGAPQHPPVPDPGGPYRGFAGLPVQLDGTRSSDPDGDALTYRWDFGDRGQSTVPAPTHVYADSGQYDVILEVSDGTYAISSATTAAIQLPVGAPPVANAGGPYRGGVAEAIPFNGSGTTDPDGDPLSLRWSFGDGGSANGAAPSHAYRSPGTYSVTLTASDGTYTSRAATTAVILTAGAIGSTRAFVRGRSTGLALGALGAGLLVQIEPVDGAFRLDDVDLTGVTLGCEGSTGVTAIRAVVPAALGGDSDANGVDEVAAMFRPEDLRRLLGHTERPTVTTLRVEGVLFQGGTFQALFKIPVTPASGHFDAVVRPNPFNPQATVLFSISKPSRVSAQLFDLNGRLVKTPLRDVAMDAGAHEITLEARGDAGAPLSSGIYFLRITGPDGPIVARLSIAK